jgi:hypothetical protein
MPGPALIAGIAKNVRNFALQNNKVKLESFAYLFFL